MTDITNRVLPPPLNWQDFERLCHDLYSHMWRTNDAEMHGRRGQPQAGVDVYGTDRLEGDRFVGVQCKLKEEGPLTEKILRAEIDKAKKFKPAPRVFVIATTAPNDFKIQRIARAISLEHAQQGLFEVRIQGWETLRQKITDYPEVLRKHFADLAPIELTAKIDANIAVTEREGEQTRTEIARLEGHLTTISERLDTGGDPLQAQITQAAKLTDDGSAQAAIRALRRIQEEQGEKLSGRNLYRLYSGIGVAHVALGELPKAIREFRKAYEAEPEWPSARSTLAVAELGRVPRGGVGAVGK